MYNDSNKYQIWKSCIGGSLFHFNDVARLAVDRENPVKGSKLRVKIKNFRPLQYIDSLNLDFYISL